MRQTERVQRWMQGPGILYQGEESWGQVEENPVVLDDDPEVVKAVKICVIKGDDVVDILERRLSKWVRMKQVMAVVLCFIRKSKERRITSKKAGVTTRQQLSETELRKVKGRHKLSDEELRKAEAGIVDELTVENLEEAERTLIKMTQHKHFFKEISELQKHSHTKETEATQKHLYRRNETKLKKKSLGKIDKLDRSLSR